MSMIPLIETHRREIESLCQRFQVRRLSLFGSAVDGSFDELRSDLDFLVEFFVLQPGQHADFYFGLLQGLEDLFRRKVDLVTVGAIRNRFFLKAVKEQQREIYAA